MDRLQKGPTPGTVLRWHVTVFCGCQRPSRRSCREEQTVSSLPSWPSPRSALLHTEKARKPKVSGAPGLHCVEEKLLRLQQQTEKSHMVAITAGTARVEKTQ